MLDFGETYEEELPRVYGYVAYQVASQEEAEDLTQQTFERALAHWGEFDDRRATITTWLLAIARNLVVDHYRARSRRPPTFRSTSYPMRSSKRPATPTRRSASVLSSSRRYRGLESASAS